MRSRKGFGFRRSRVLERSQAGGVGVRCEKVLENTLVVPSSQGLPKQAKTLVIRLCDRLS